MEDTKKIVVVVEDTEASRTAFLWALHNLIRHGDIITLLHVYISSSSSSTNNSNTNKGRIIKKIKKQRFTRLKAFQLALSFKETSKDFPNAKIEIVVAEAEEELEDTIIRLVREIGANTLVVGLHDHSFIYRLGMAHNNIASIFNCKVLAINQPTTPLNTSKRRTSPKIRDPASTIQNSTNMNFSQIEISSSFRVPHIIPPKIPYRICPDPSAIIWRSRKTRRKSNINSQ